MYVYIYIYIYIYTHTYFERPSAEDAKVAAETISVILPCANEAPGPSPELLRG